MAVSYSALQADVRAWSNRDTVALPDTVIQQSLRFSADTAYRELKIPPLESTFRFVLLQSSANETAQDVTQVVIESNAAQVNLVQREATLPVPSDTVSFISLRILGTAVRSTTSFIADSTTVGNYVLNAAGDPTVTESNLRSGIVFNEKVDVRTFHDLSGEKKSANYWTRQAGNLLVNGFIGAEDVIELYYYRRLPALGALYDITGLPSTDSRVIDTNGVLTGAEVPNWLVNENEKILLFGALWQCFDYLQEDPQSAKYQQKYFDAIQEQNEEEKRRRASGGNVQVNYNGGGLL